MTDVMVHMKAAVRTAIFFIALAAACAGTALYFRNEIVLRLVSSLATSSGVAVEIEGLQIRKGSGLSAQMTVTRLAIRGKAASLEGRGSGTASVRGISLKLDRGVARAGGLEFHDISFSADAFIGESRAALRNGSGSIFGGRISVPLFRAAHGTFESFTASFSRFDLEQILAFYAPAGVQGTGVISGKVTVSPAPGLPRISAGAFQSDGPGVIAVDRARVSLPQNPGAELLQRALEDFRYSDIHGTVSSDDRGTMKIAATFTGVSPRVDTDRPLVLNLTIEENIPKLIESLRLL